MKKCNSCSQPMKDGDLHCRHCGAATVKGVTAVAWVTSIAIVVTVWALLFYVYSSTHSTSSNVANTISVLSQLNGTAVASPPVQPNVSATTQAQQPQPTDDTVNHNDASNTPAPKATEPADDYALSMTLTALIEHNFPDTQRTHVFAKVEQGMIILEGAVDNEATRTRVVQLVEEYPERNHVPVINGLSIALPDNTDPHITSANETTPMPTAPSKPSKPSRVGASVHKLLKKISQWSDTIPE